MLNIIAKHYDEENIANTDNHHLFDMLDLLVEKYNFYYYEYKLLLEKNAEDLLLKKFGKLPNNIIVLKGSSGIKDFKIDFSKIKVSFIIVDIHQQGIIRRKRKESLKYVYKVFATYAYHFYNKFPTLNYKLIWFPHSIRYMINFNDSPINKIFMPGRLNKDIYPGREKLKQLSKNNNNIIILKPNVNYRINKDNLKDNSLFGEAYYKKLSTYICCFTDDLIPERPYLVAKHFEIMGSGSLLLANNPNTKEHFEKLGYIDGQHYISCTIENIEEKINWILDIKNKNKVDKIRKNGYNLVRSKDTWIHRTADFLNHFK